MNRFLANPVLWLAAAATWSCAAPVLAQTSDPVPSAVVKYGDLNIASPVGAQALLKRIDVAADIACGRSPDIRRLDQLARFEACRRTAVARAVAAVGSPTLTAIAHGGAPGALAAR
jgi:UrcA family protein